MRKARAAEWLLSLTTTRERAASTAGDLIEEAATRGSAWFWFSLVRTTAALVWRAWTDNPLKMMKLGLGAFLYEIGLMLLMLGLAIPITIAVWVFLASGLISLDYFPMWSSPTDWQMNLAFAAAAFAETSVCVFAVGKWIGRRLPGQPLPACAAFLVTDRLLLMSLSLIRSSGGSSANWTGFGLASNFVMTVAGTAFVIAGATRARKRAEYAETNPPA